MDKTKLLQIMEDKKIEAIISESPQTRLWYAKVSTSDGYIVIEKDKATLFVDSRYIEYARKNAQNVEVVLLANNSLKEFLAEKKYKTIAFEENYLTLTKAKLIKSMSPKSKYLSINAQKLRIVKSNEEVDKIQKAVTISLLAFEELKKVLKVGMTEREIDHKLNYLMKRFGAEKESFTTIAASGPNSAMPHHHPTYRQIQEGELLTIDFGAKYQGYAADITRTFIFGGEDKVKDPTYLEILQIVKEAAKLGRDAVKPGVTVASIDQICRDYIKEKGYGQYFVHSTGHGLGIDVHEFPVVVESSKEMLEPGQVITVEPGIYIEGVGGARIEDDILVTNNGRIVLSRKEDN